MIQQKNQSDFEFAFFTDKDDNSLIGLLHEGDYFDARNPNTVINFRFEGENVIFFTDTKELTVGKVSGELLQMLEKQDAIYIMLVDHDILAECRKAE